MLALLLVLWLCHAVILETYGLGRNHAPVTVFGVPALAGLLRKHGCAGSWWEPPKPRVQRYREWRS